MKALAFLVFWLAFFMVAILGAAHAEKLEAVSQRAMALGFIEVATQER